MNKTLFSVLIANYNNGKYIHDCLDSILNQTYQNFEVIIVDDASTDSSLDVIKAYVKNDTRLKLYVNENNQGCGYTKRRCAELATGDICAFVDPDDAIVSNAIELMVSTYQNDATIDSISSRYIETDINLIEINKSSQGETIPESFSYLTYGKGAITHFYTFKLGAYKKTEGINPKLSRAVDQDLYYKMEEVGKHLFLDKHLYLYRVTPLSISMNDNRLKAKNTHYKVKIASYYRRKNLKDINNLSKVEFVNLLENYFLGKIKQAKQERDFFERYKYTFCYFFKFPKRSVKNAIIKSNKQ